MDIKYRRSGDFDGVAENLAQRIICGSQTSCIQWVYNFLTEIYSPDKTGSRPSMDERPLPIKNSEPINLLSQKPTHTSINKDVLPSNKRRLKVESISQIITSRLVRFTLRDFTITFRLSLRGNCDWRNRWSSNRTTLLPLSQKPPVQTSLFWLNDGSFITNSMAIEQLQFTNYMKNMDL